MEAVGELSDYEEFVDSGLKDKVKKKVYEARMDEGKEQLEGGK